MLPLALSLGSLSLAASHASATHYTPEPDASSSAAQLALYAAVRPFLPKLAISEYPKNSVKVYMFPGAGGDRTTCKDDTAPLYWTWYSTARLGPILSGATSNGCGATAAAATAAVGSAPAPQPQRSSGCPDSPRFSGSFYQCELAGGVNTGSYTWSGFDRGHMVNSGFLARQYDASCQTFSMCNIAPQSPQCNQKDWVAIENLANALGEATAGIHVLQGSLFHADEEAHEPQCVCGANEGVGTVPCKDVAKRGDCNDGDWQIRVPYGFFKTVIDPAANASWSFVYTKAQREKGPQIKCDGVCETPQQAFLEGRKNVAAALAAPAHFHSWEAVEEMAATECSWCEDFNATEWQEMGPVVAEAEVLLDE